jgi:hypothetical protein
MRTGDDVLKSAHGIASALKPILTNGQATFIFVGGTETASLWRKEQGIRDSILPSIFTDHVHIGLVDENYVKALLELNVSDWNGNWNADHADEIKASLIYGLLFQSSGILKDLLVELRSIATKNERSRGIVDVSALKSIVEDPVFRQNAKKAFAIEYTINEYRPDKEANPIAKRLPYRKDASLMDDVKRAYYELAQGRMDENAISIEFLKLIHKGYINELPQLDAIAKVLAEFPGSPTLDYPEVMNLYENIVAAVKTRWPSEYPSESE